jgi:glyoxylate reductase
MKVVVSRSIPDDGIILLKEKFEVNYNDSDEKLSTEELIERCKDADALISLLDDPITEDFIKKCPNLKVIANYAVGYNNIDVNAAKENGVYVCNTPDVLTNATADLTMALLLSVSRRIVESHNYTIHNKFKGWGAKLYRGYDFLGKILGIIGPGRIGSSVAVRAMSFGLRIIYFSRTSKPKLDALGAKKVDLDELVRTSDFIALTVPLTDDTHYILDENEFSKMKKGTIIINTGRGPLINEEVLVKYLKNGKLGGAGLDVYEKEPKIHPGLFELENVILLPHIGSATYETRSEMSKMVASDIIEVLENREPKNAVVKP